MRFNVWMISQLSSKYFYVRSTAEHKHHSHKKPLAHFACRSTKQYTCKYGTRSIIRTCQRATKIVNQDRVRIPSLATLHGIHMRSRLWFPHVHKKCRKHAVMCRNSVARIAPMLNPSSDNLWHPYEEQGNFATSHYNDVIMDAIASQITSLVIVYSAVYSDADQRKHQSSASLAFVRGIHRDRWIPRTNGQ